VTAHGIDVEAERFIEGVGFVSCLTDSRNPGASLYVAVCGRRDAVTPRHVQKEPGCSQTINSHFSSSTCVLATNLMDSVFLGARGDYGFTLCNLLGLPLFAFMRVMGI